MGSNTLRIFEKDVNYDELQCKKNVGSSVRNTRTRCGNGEGYIKEIGYQVTTKGWSILIKVCYDDDRGATLYSEHNLYGYEIKCKFIF